MPRVVPATGALLEEILDETYPVWAEGLSRKNYARFNQAQLKTTWGATHLLRVALVSNDGRLLSTLKRYALAARIDGRPVRVLGIGAVFTPPDRRRQGFAGDLIERVIDAGVRDGFDLALLFSAIGPDYYERFGFETVPVEQVSISVRPGARTPAMLVRVGEERDAKFLAEMHEARTAAGAWRFTLDRDPDFIRFSIARKRLLAGFGPSGLRHVEYFVVDEAERPAAYVVLLRSNGGRILSECGDRDSTGARVGALFEAVFARTPAEQPAPIRGWLPPGFRPPQLHTVRPERSSVTMMLRPLRRDLAIAPPLAARDVMYWLGDVV